MTYLAGFFGISGPAGGDNSPPELLSDDESYLSMPAVGCIFVTIVLCLVTMVIMAHQKQNPREKKSLAEKDVSKGGDDDDTTTAGGDQKWGLSDNIRERIEPTRELVVGDDGVRTEPVF